MLCRSLRWTTAIFAFCISYLLVAVTVVLVPLQARADISGFGNFSNFTINQGDGGSAPTVTPGSIQLTRNSINEVRSVFCNTPQDVSSFTAKVTYQATNVTYQYVGGPDGASVVLQNSSAGAAALGNGNLYSWGYGGITKSAGVTLELWGNSASGFYTNGNLGGGSPSTSPVNLLSGDPIDITLIYDGSMLHENLRDTTTSASYDAYYIANLPAIMGGSTAYVGVTAFNADNNAANQYFSNFQFTHAVPEPSTYALLLSVFVGGVLWRRSRCQSRGMGVV